MRSGAVRRLRMVTVRFDASVRFVDGLLCRFSLVWNTLCFTLQPVNRNHASTGLRKIIGDVLGHDFWYQLARMCMVQNSQCS